MPGDENGSTEMDQLRETVGSLAENMKGIQTLVAGLGQGQTALQTSVQEMTTSLSNGFKQSNESDKDIDMTDMSMPDVAQHIMKGVQEIVKESADGLRKEMDEFKTSSVRSERSKDLNAFLEKHKDGAEWMDEMRKIAGDNPNLSFDQMRNLARTDNPTKASELDEKFKDPKKDEDENKDDQGKIFGGLTPTSSTSGDPISKEPDTGKQMSTKEGLLKAWDEVIPDAMKREASEDIFS